MVLGAISIDGHLLYQVLHGNSTPSLVSTDHLLSADFVQGWRIEGTSALVKIRVGSAILQLKSLYHNFLEVKPDQRVECVFSLKNVGTSTLLLEKPQVSCSCIETGDSQPSSIAPNDTKTLSVALHPKGSFHHAVALTLFDKGSPVPRRVTLDLLGVTRASMKITPKAVDFGVVVPGSSISRTVLLTEVPTDRFSILTVDTGSLPITWKTEESKDNNGLSSYLLRLGLNVAQAAPTRHEGAIVVTTNSISRPRVAIPIAFHVAPYVRAVPSVVSLGTIRVGDVREQKIQFVSRDGAPISLTIDKTAEDCVTAVDNTHPAQLLVRLRPQTVGIWQRQLRITAHSASRHELVEINCVAYVE